jgi:hypothetical protein
MALKLRPLPNFKFRSLFETTITVLNLHSKEAKSSAQGENCNACNLEHRPNPIDVEIQNDLKLPFLSPQT